MEAARHPHGVDMMAKYVVHAQLSLMLATGAHAQHSVSVRGWHALMRDDGANGEAADEHAM